MKGPNTTSSFRRPYPKLWRQISVSVILKLAQKFGVEAPEFAIEAPKFGIGAIKFGIGWLRGLE